MPRRSPVVSFVGLDGGWTACDALPSWQETKWWCLMRIGPRTGIGSARRRKSSRGNSHTSGPRVSKEGSRVVAGQESLELDKFPMR